MRTLLPFVLIVTCYLNCLHAGSSSPNILIAVSDDQSYPHASAYGDRVASTPGFDEVARRGVLFTRAFSPAPGCSPMRAAFLTGRYIWQLGPAGTHASSFPRELRTFPELLAAQGYAVGMTGKGWGPGNYKISGREDNPAGKAFARHKRDAPEGVSSTDYAANFEEFLSSREAQQPFCFWFGGHEPHRPFGKGLGKANGLRSEQVVVPEFLPDASEVRSDLLDYYFEISQFDSHLERMLRLLEENGELENTLIIVTSDNGMAFPRAKANLYEYGIHMPLAVCWPTLVRGERRCDSLVNLIDLTATIFEICELSVESEHAPSGNSLLGYLAGEEEITQQAVFSGRERHSSSRFNSLGYPSRCVRTDEYLYIRNFKPERWPAGAPQKYNTVSYVGDGLGEHQLGDEHGGYHDIDACPTLDWMIENRADPRVRVLLDAAVGLRPGEELYRISNAGEELDSACLNNLADNIDSQEVLILHRDLLASELTRTGDVRFIAAASGNPATDDVWETYPRYSPLRWFPTPDWARENPSAIPMQPWLEAQRPR